MNYKMVARFYALILGIEAFFMLPSLFISIYDTKRAEQEHIANNIKYHIEFFRNGLNAIIKLWLAGGCQESPEEMAEVLKTEYRGR